MEFRVVAETVDCEGGNCPTTYIRKEGTVVVQGYRTAIAGRLRVSVDVLQRHARAEGDDTWAGPATPDGPGWVLVDGRETELPGISLPRNEGLIEIELARA
ncbi:hypothetical protein [Pseudonocardia sp. WMMC193]|uniref:hypothetical protein n=1 Tax=Pseudonocardia sp. WMMC193 TaxID=2911965 RepID=UPI001F4500AD|nr:hypothetical protein [Pseudonocardia sp. WMMC193]MCF7547286.1 hypothetical protein [Pseudonocardia sp. WMMC193]MCF7547381.1 hypothetical protein [Pseudonocardia sp. WMMC193]